jgi:DNA modification methylase
MKLSKQVQKYIYYEEKNIILLHGDSKTILPMLPKANMIWTDPPYNALKSWNKSTANKETRLDPSDWFLNDAMDWDKYNEFLKSIFKNFTGHSIYVCCDFRVYPIMLKHISPYKLKHCIVWAKNVWGLGKKYRFQHEFIIYATLKSAPFYGNRAQSDIWHIDVDRNTDHQTPKPINLSAKAICNSTKIGDLIIDPFLGSGGAAVAAKNLDRKCIGIDLEEKNLDVTIKRIRDYTSGNYRSRKPITNEGLFY